MTLAIVSQIMCMVGDLFSDSFMKTLSVFAPSRPPADLASTVCCNCRTFSTVPPTPLCTALAVRASGSSVVGFSLDIHKNMWPKTLSVYSQQSECQSESCQQKSQLREWLEWISAKILESTFQTVISSCMKLAQLFAMGQEITRYLHKRFASFACCNK